MTTRFQNLMERAQACADARAWVGTRSMVDAWYACERPDWLIWFAGESGAVSDRDWRLLACAFARSVLQNTAPGDDRPRKAIEAAERYAHGTGTLKAMRAARSAADSAAECADLNAGRRAAESAADSAAWSAGDCAPRSAAGAASSAASSAARRAAESAADSAATSAARSAATSAATSEARRAQCRLIRGRLCLRAVYTGYATRFPEMFK